MLWIVSWDCVKSKTTLPSIALVCEVPANDTDFVEVGVLRVLPRSAVVSFVVALTTTIAVIPHCRTERNHSWCLVTLALLVVFLVPVGGFTASPVRQVVLLPLVDQSLANEQESLEGFLILVHFVLPQCLLELLVKHRI